MPLTVKSGHPCPGVSLRQAGYGAMRTSFRVVSEEALILNLHSLPVCLDLCGKPSYSGDLVSSLVSSRVVLGSFCISNPVLASASASTKLMM